MALRAQVISGDFVTLFEKWCDRTVDEKGRRFYWTLVEKAGGRDNVRDHLIQTVRSHYDWLEHIADDVERLGYKAAAKILKSELPQGKKGRSGDLGEILATELVEEMVDLCVPVRRLRYKDGREMAMRGDDFIGVGESESGKLWLLKGEAKSAAKLNKTTITKAREVLNRDNGRCTPGSLLFVAKLLLESDDEDDVALGRLIRDEVGLEAVPHARIDHMLFTLSGNAPPADLKSDLEAASINRRQFVINLRIEDHKDFIAEVYQEAENLGDD